MIAFKSSFNIFVSGFFCPQLWSEEINYLDECIVNFIVTEQHFLIKAAGIFILIIPSYRLIQIRMWHCCESKSISLKNGSGMSPKKKKSVVFILFLNMRKRVSDKHFLVTSAEST